MAKSRSKMYFGWDWIVCVILAILVFPTWILGGIVRIQRDHKISGLIWLLTGGFLGIGILVDIVTIIFQKEIVFFA